MTDTLTKLFGSAARVKLLRLFLFNPRQSVTTKDAATRARVRSKDARKELGLLVRLNLLERHSRRSGARYTLSSNSPYVLALQNLLLNTPARGEEMYGRLRSAGALKFIVVSGIFIGEWDSSIDLLVVGDRMRESNLREKVRLLEAEVGKEIRYAALTTSDFLYRLNMNDHLIRDVFDYPHRVVFDRLDIGLK
ncbi:MAG: hypothetical protein U1C66_02530 [Patescibacteria group bacterium]|nr:hypothetical protein [Patescibacteria group bacterium]